MEQNRIKEILKKIDSGGETPLMPVLNKYEPLKVETEPKREAPPAAVKISKWRIYAAAMVAFLLLAGAGYGLTLVYKNYRGIMSVSPESVIVAVGKLTELPQDETPVVYTLTEVESLKENPFLKDARIGDMILEFKKARKAYIYRPTTQKLIGIAPLSQ